MGRSSNSPTSRRASDGVKPCRRCRPSRRSGQGTQATPATTVTVNELVPLYIRDHFAHHCKASTAKAYRPLVDRFILPAYGHLPVEKVDRDHIARLHRDLGDRPSQANRVLEIAVKLFNLADEWKLRTGGNSCRSVRKYPEQRRERFLTDEEFHRLGPVLNEIETDGSETLSAVTMIRLLMLTGRRLSEIQTLRWEDVNLEAAEIGLRDGKTGARMVPLSGAAVSVLSALPRPENNPWVIFGRKPGANLTDLHHPWRPIRARADLDDVRVHDLRHSYAASAYQHAA